MQSKLFVATRKGLFTLEQDPAGTPPWRITATCFLGDPVTMLLPVAHTRQVFAALDHGHFGVKLHRSNDAGASWTEVGAPEYPPKPDDIEDIDVFSGQPIPWTLKRIWSMAAAHDQLWCGTMPGGLFQSGDGGEHWRLVDALWQHPSRTRWMGGGADWPGIHSILVDPRDSQHVTVGVSVGGVWTTRDGGKSWESRTEGMWAAYSPPDQARQPEMQDSHCVAQCPAAPDVLWCQHHNGVFRSTDGGKNWREIKTVIPSAFGFTVAVHPQDADIAWFVPALKDEQRIPVDGKLVVARTRNGGESFQVSSAGLPQEHAYDLVYRHALDVDSTGQRLAFGSTTGGLWTSEDGGERWQEISAHLPPVYCVKFA